MNQAVTAIFLLGLANAVLGQFFGQQQQQPQTLSFAIQPPPLQQPVPSAQFNTVQPASPQFTVAQPASTQFNPQFDSSRRSYAHRAVVVNAEHEAQLPPQLLNPFYKNPRISEALAKESWFTNEETLVQDREAEKISRQKIYSVLKNAGFVNRRRR